MGRAAESQHGPLTFAAVAPLLVVFATIALLDPVLRAAGGPDLGTAVASFVEMGKERERPDES